MMNRQGYPPTNYGYNTNNTHQNYHTPYSHQNHHHRYNAQPGPSNYSHYQSPSSQDANMSVDVFATPPKKNCGREESLSDAIKVGMDMVDNDIFPIEVTQPAAAPITASAFSSSAARNGMEGRSFEVRRQEQNRGGFYGGARQQQFLQPHPPPHPHPHPVLAAYPTPSPHNPALPAYPSPAQLLFRKRPMNMLQPSPQFRHPHPPQPYYFPQSQGQTQASIDPFESQRMSQGQSQGQNRNSQRQTKIPWALKKQNLEDEMRKQMEDDFMPYGKEVKTAKRGPKPKQIRMDDYLFKARRVDKGCREFGLKTTHQPKRGSKKKRLSEGLLEVENEPERKEPEVLNLDATVPLTSPICSSPKVEKMASELDRTPELNYSSLKKLGQVDKKPCVPAFRRLYHQYTKENKEAETKSPEKAKPVELDETLPPLPATPSPVRPPRNKKPRSFLVENIIEPSSPSTSQTAKRSKKDSPSPLKFSFSQAATFLGSGKKKGPVFDIPPPVVLSDGEGNDDDEIQRIDPVAEAKENRSCQVRESCRQRKIFDAQVSEREQLIKSLVNDTFVEKRESSMKQSKDEARNALNDGEVIRNKAARQNLMHGKSCKCCQGYYDNLDMAPDKKNAYINEVSRHRYVHLAMPDTPEHYWDLTMGPTDEELMGLEGNGAGSQKSSRKLKNQEWVKNEKATRVTLATWD